MKTPSDLVLYLFITVVNDDLNMRRYIVIFDIYMNRIVLYMFNW